MAHPTSSEPGSQAMRFVGTSVERTEDRRLIDGTAWFGADVARVGALQAMFVRSAVAHGTIRSIDASAARSTPGVHAVLLAADLAPITASLVVRSLPTFPALTHPALADERVRFVGDPIALVLAETLAAAQDAADLVAIDFDARPALNSHAQAQLPSAPIIWNETTSNVLWQFDERFGGECGDLFSDAAQTVEITIAGNRVAPAPIECRTIVAETDASGRELDVWTGTQNPNALRAGLAGLLGWPVTRVRVHNTAIGGSFGQKGWVRAEDVAIAAAAIITRRPIRWVESRTENLQVGGHARDDHLRVAASVNADGVVRAARLDLTIDQGAYPLFGSVRDATCRIVRTMFPGPYRMEALDFNAQLVATNKGSYVTYRGPWAAEALARERLIDTVARRIGVEPLELRRRNLVADDDATAAMITGPTLDGLRLHEACDVMERHLDVDRFRDQQAHDREVGRYRGVGFSMLLEPAPGPPNFFPSVGAFVAPPEPARVRLEIDGSVSVYLAQVPSGQGHETTFAQVAADVLGVDLPTVSVFHGDTDSAPFTLFGTGGSRAAFRTGGAVAAAATALRSRIVEVAAMLLEASPDDLEVRDGAVSVRGTPTRSMGLATIAMAGWHGAAMLGDVPERFDAFASFGAPGPGWSQALHAAVVEADIETGRVTVERYVVVADCGGLINPAIVEGQVQGGVCQGIASALYETIHYDADGQPLASNLAEYRVPSAVELPRIEVVHLESAHDAAPRGVGEGGAIGAPAAIINAIEDALSPFGFVATSAHVTPEDIVKHIVNAAS